jgi:hypothetical protein
MERITDEHGNGIRAWMAVDGGKSHLTEHDRSACCRADHSRTINKRVLIGADISVHSLRRSQMVRSDFGDQNRSWVMIMSLEIHFSVL